MAVNNPTSPTNTSNQDTPEEKHIDCDKCNGTGQIKVTPLAYWRKQRGLTQKDVADELGVTRAQYSNIEIGKTETSLRGVKIIAGLFGVSIEEVVEAIL